MGSLWALVSTLGSSGNSYSEKSLDPLSSSCFISKDREEEEKDRERVLMMPLKTISFKGGMMKKLFTFGGFFCFVVAKGSEGMDFSVHGRGG
jgi:hypothetical protein